MEASELRIGNFVRHKPIYSYRNRSKELKEFDFQIEQDDFYKDLECLISIENDIEPIPLTEEWLIQFGFTEEYRSKMHSTFYAENLSYYFWYENKKQYASFKGTDIVCQYVHQLQNLYFALTGEELTLKP